jgi:hypothetical protein
VKEELWRWWIDVLASALHKQWSLPGHSTRSRVRRTSGPHGSPVGDNQLTTVVQSYFVCL